MTLFILKIQKIKHFTRINQNQIKSITSMIIVALTSGVSRPLSIMNFECNVNFLRYDN